MSSEVIIHVGSGHTKAVITSWAHAPKCSLQTLASLLLMHAQLLCKGNYRHQREVSASDLRIKDGVLIPISFLQASNINGKIPVRFPIPPLVKGYQQAQGWLAWRTSPFPGVLPDSSFPPAVVSVPAALQVPCAPMGSVEPPSHEVCICWCSGIFFVNFHVAIRAGCGSKTTSLSHR